jgi:eukaryotic-like serine/threonine-protein kinase
MFSPDGRWIAYVSNESGQPNVYVQPFPAASEKFQVSRGVGGLPAWRADGKELFYLGQDGNMMAVSVEATGPFKAGLPQPLFLTGATTFQSWQYAVTKDGQLVLSNARPQETSAAPLTVVINWTAGVQK